MCDSLAAEVEVSVETWALVTSLSSPSWRSFPHLANFLGFGYVCSKQNPLYVLQGLPISVCICAMGRKLYVKVLYFGT